MHVFFFQESASTHPTRIQIRELSPKNKFYHNLLEASGEKNNSRPKDLLKENMHTTTTQLLHPGLNQFLNTLHQKLNIIMLFNKSEVKEATFSRNHKKLGNRPWRSIKNILQNSDLPMNSATGQSMGLWSLTLALANLMSTGEKICYFLCFAISFGLNPVSPTCLLDRKRK